MKAFLDRAIPQPRMRPVTWRRVRRVGGWTLLGAVIAIWILFLRPNTLGGSAAYVIVSGHSMEPKLHTGDLVVALRQRTYRRGAVIAYHIPQNQAGAGALIIHRIVGGSARDGYITRGDNRAYRDPWRPKASDIAGQMKLHVPRLGMLPVYAHTLFGMALIAAFAGFVVFLGDAGRKSVVEPPRRTDTWGEAEWTARDLASDAAAREVGARGPR
jgi:signal peptidase I